MEYGASKRVKKDSYIEMSKITILEGTSASTACIDIDVNHLKQEPRFETFVKGKPAFWMKERILEDSSTDEQQGVPGTSTGAIVDSTNVAADSAKQSMLLHTMKLEHTDMDFEPTVFHNTDSGYRTNQMSSKPLLTNDMSEGLLYILASGNDSGSEVGESMILSGVENEINIATLPVCIEGADGILTPVTTCALPSPHPPPVRQCSSSWSPQPGPSQLTTPWSQEDERCSPQREINGGEGEWDGVVPEARVEIDVEDPAPPVNASVAPGRPSWGGLQSRRLRTRLCNRGRGHHGATYAASGEREWHRGQRLTEICVRDEDVPPRLREVLDDVVRVQEREQQRRSRGARESRERGDESEDELYDQKSALGLFNGDISALKFDWSPMETFQGSQEPFLLETTGPVRNYSSAYEAFRTFWDDDILGHVVVETNRYAAEISSQSARFAREWVDTNSDEILILFSFWMMLAIIPMPSIKSCFSNDPLLETGVFKRLITQQRYWLLNRALHFMDNSTQTRQSSKLFCLGPVLDHLNSKFMESYTPGQDISIDESLTLWRGNLSFRQYIKTKAAKFGIKSYELCEAATGYLWSFQVYTGNTSLMASPSSLPKSTKVVIDLITPLLHKGYRLFMDNRFNSPILARYLKGHQTDCVGMLRKTPPNVSSLIQYATLPEGSFIMRHAGDVVVMAYQDKKPIYTISTCHSNTMVQIKARPGRPACYKPSVIDDYNRGMNGVDKKDQMLESYLVERKKCQQWYKKLFKRLLNASVLNSKILVERTSNDQVKQLTFRLNLVSEIVKRHLGQVPTPRQRQVSTRNLLEDRLIGQHFIVRSNVGIQLTTGKSHISKGKRYCVWCTIREKRYRRTVYVCDKCGVSLCLGECFKKYHTIP